MIYWFYLIPAFIGGMLVGLIDAHMIYTKKFKKKRDGL